MSSAVQRTPRRPQVSGHGLAQGPIAERVDPGEQVARQPFLPTGGQPLPDLAREGVEREDVRPERRGPAAIVAQQAPECGDLPASGRQTRGAAGADGRRGDRARPRGVQRRSGRVRETRVPEPTDGTKWPSDVSWS